MRQSARNLSLRKRYLALSSNERNKCHELLFAFNRLSYFATRPQFSPLNRRRALLLSVLAYNSLISIMVGEDPELDAIEDLQRSIDSFSEADCWMFFRTRKHDLYRLYRAFLMPENVILSNGSSMPGEEVMLRGLYQLVSGCDQHEVSIVFGRDQSQQSRAFAWFVDHIYSTFVDLVTNNLEWWYAGGHLHRSMEAIKAKFGGNDAFDFFGFIDCNGLECARPAGGPAEPGPHAPRWDPEIQRAFYNGWKCVHGLKHQTVDIAYGMTIDIYGPQSLRRSDLQLLAQSDINRRLRDLQENAPIQLRLLGDKIYPWLSHLRSAWRYPDVNWKELENAMISKVRISIEWNYMATATLFGYLRAHDKLKLLSSDYVSHLYIVGTILRNCHVALYGSETSSYFGVTLPDNFLEQYMRVV